MERKNRKKIEMKMIEDYEERYVSFSKRRNGLFKKCAELCTTCKVHLGLIIFTPSNKAHSFFHPHMDTVINKFFQRNQQILSQPNHPVIMPAVQAYIQNMNQQLNDLDAQSEAEALRAKQLKAIVSPRHLAYNKFLGFSLEELDKERIVSLKSWATHMLAALKIHSQKLKNGASSSNAPQN